jgi:hypothetical protein
MRAFFLTRVPTDHVAAAAIASSANDAAIQRINALDCFASLAMTETVILGAALGFIGKQP